jgi:hypothetical protein
MQTAVVGQIFAILLQPEITTQFQVQTARGGSAVANLLSIT